MATKRQTSVIIQPLQYADIDACARISAAAFSTDRHTIVKQLGDKAFYMYEVSRQGFLDTLHKNTYIYVKAVDVDGQIVGHAGWGFRGVDEDKIPRIEPSDEAPLINNTPEDTSMSGENTLDTGSGEKATTDPQHGQGSIERLRALENKDLHDSMAELMPPGTSCMYFIGLSVSPAQQSRGIGTALISHGTAIADRLGIFTWVHSSDQAWKAYEKFGFKVVKELALNLDEYAPQRPGKEWAAKLEGTGEGVTEDAWGPYVLRYLKRTTGGSSPL